MKNILKIKIKLVICVFLLLGLVIGALFLFEKTNLKLNEYLKSKEDFSSFQKKVSSFDLQEKNYNKILPSFSKIENAFFEPKEETKNKEISDILENIENEGKEEGAEVSIKDIISPTQKDNFYLFKIEAKGSFASLLRFIFFLENTPVKKYYLIEINKINLSRVVSGECAGESNENCENKNPKVNVSGEIEFKIFTKKHEKEG